MMFDRTDLDAIAMRLGRDFDLVQGAGGNISVKADNVLWVKASGKRLVDAGKENIFVGVDLAQLRARIAAGRGEDLAGTVTDAGANLRPSIETTLHALMPQRYVLHVHSVRAIAIGVRQDGEVEFRSRFAGLRWAFVPYCRPGWPLTQAVAAALAQCVPDILVLANHGVVVSGDTADAALATLAEIERRIDGPVRPPWAGDRERLDRLTRHTGFMPSSHDEVHTLAAPQAAAIASAGTLYPDHVVFLGAGMAVLRSAKDLVSPPRPAWIVPGAGVVERQGLSSAAREMLRALARVVARIPDDAVLRCLSQDDERELTSWDAEQYRSAVA